MRCILLPSILALTGALAVMGGPRPTHQDASQAGAQPAVESPPPVLLVQSTEGEPSRPVAIESCEIDVVIQGILARTTTTLTFRNDHDRVLEGQFFFPIPDHSTVSGYSIDVDGHLVDAVPVERQAARVAFESEVRKGIDPGLLEWQQGNTFHLRIWPIPAQGVRTVRVEYITELPSIAGQSIYHLPLHYRSEIDRFELSVDVVKPSGLPTVLSGELVNFEFDAGRCNAMAEFVGNTVTPDEDVRIAIPRADADGWQVFVERGAAPDEYFFMATEVAPHVDLEKVRQPERIGIIWDASLSRAEADHDREFAFLRALLDRFEQVEVGVTILRNSVERGPSFVVRDGEAAELITFLQSIPFDGGTSFSGLHLAPANDVGWHVLFSDGLTSLGDELPMSTDAPIYAVSSTAGANTALLRFVSRGGSHINLMTEEPDGAASQVGERSPYKHVSYDPIAFTDVEVRRAGSGGQSVITGRMVARQGALRVEYNDGDETERTIAIDTANALSSSLVRYTFANMRINSLAAQPERNHDALLAVGLEFGVVTPSTSLLVLETLDQHLTYGIKPHAARTEMLAQYQTAMAQGEEQRVTSRAARLDRVAAAWGERVRWWESNFKYEADFRYHEPGQENDIDGSPANAPRATAPASEAPARDAAGEGSEVLSLESRRGGGFGAEGEAIDMLEATLDDEQASDGGAQSRRRRASRITINQWNPDTPYLKALTEANEADPYVLYLELRNEHGSSPAFFLDCADFFFRSGAIETAVRVLSNITELRIDDPRLLRVAAHRFEQYQQIDVAVILFEKIRRLRPEEPQSHRDLALALAKRSDYLRALELLEQVVAGEWDRRFSNIQLIALNEYNDILTGLSVPGHLPEGSIAHNDQLTRHMPVDTRIVIQWDTDLTDIDLWVTEPSGERCLYSHNRTTIGGFMTDDYTQGYGPEVYMLRRAMPGEYTIQAHFFGSGQQTLTGPTTVRAVVITNFGRDEEQRQELTLRLDKPEEVYTIGTVQIGQ